MRLADIPAWLLEDMLRKWRRRAIGIAVIALCALIAAAEGLAALRLALEAALGPVWARVVLAAFFLSIIVGTVLTLGWLERRARTAPGRGRDQAAGEAAKDERVSLIAEAIDLGYSLARDLKQPAKPAAAPPAAEHGAPLAEPGAPHKNGARSGRRSAAG